MSSPTQTSGGTKNPAGAAAFWNRLHRYRTLVSKYWWLLVLTLSVALFVAAWLQMTRPVSFMSVAKTSVDMESKLVSFGPQGNSAFGQESLDDFMTRQRSAILDTPITKLASDKLQAAYPDMPPSDAKLDVIPTAGTFTFIATGTNPVYTQRYLQSVVDAYLDNRRKEKNLSGGEVLGRVQDQIPILEERIRREDADMLRFQQDHHDVFSRDKSNGAIADLAALKARLAQLSDEFTNQSLITPDQGLYRQPAVTRAGGGNNGNAAAPVPGGMEDATSMGAYRDAQDTIARLQAELDDWSSVMKPKHPKIIALQTKIDSNKKFMTALLEQNRQSLQSRREQLRTLIQNTKDQITQAEPKAQAAELLQVEFDKMDEAKQRDLKTYNDLQKTLSDAALTKSADVDYVRMTEAATPAMQVPSAWLKFLSLALVVGLGSGVGILAVIDRMDDRMNSIGDFQGQFSEHVIGQIPRDTSTGQAELLRPDDQRHQLVESFRNLRSTLLYMPLDGARPKTILVTSAIPNEGKSTLSSNLALVMAFAGMKTLLIDGDLRRGEIHNAFGVSRDPGFTDVLGHNVNWKIAIRQTGVENLHVLPRGRNVPQPSEYLLNKNTDQLLQELYPLYDYIIIDSSPVLAADDTASLAPKIDATLFVVRLAFTPAKMTRKSLEILYGRQANIPGLILNQVDTNSPEFVYYQYSEYYHAMTPEEEGSKPVKKAKPPIQVG